MIRRIEPLSGGYVELIDKMGSDKTIVSAARVSYLSEQTDSKRDRALIRYLLENKHMSPFEHVVFQFRVKCPLFVARQWMRHRTGSYNEVSRRYTSEEMDFYIPLSYRKQSENNKQMSLGIFEEPVNKALKCVIERYSKQALSTYEYLIKLGVSREMARMVLPTNMFTKFYFTMDLRNLLHFIELRNHEHAQEEIRVYAEAMADMIYEFVPITMEEWRGLSEN